VEGAVTASLLAIRHYTVKETKDKLIKTKEKRPPFLRSLDQKIELPLHPTSQVPFYTSIKAQDEHAQYAHCLS
jgi:hypothetical protein